MTPTRTRTLLLAAVVVAAGGWAALQAWAGSGHELPMLPWSAPLLLLVVSGAVLAAGWPVRQWTRGGRDRPLDPIRAARTAVLAKAAQVAGSLLTGWYAAQALVLAPDADVSARRDALVRALVTLAASALLWGVGWLVERWCRVPPEDDRQGRVPPRGTAAT
ncbi:DUF3180 domain-containing protein [Angustibacter aerolatus]